MSHYVIGDVQGCFAQLMDLLAHIDFDEGRDQLWFVGDLVNRGPASLQVLRFVSTLKTTKVTLGNHDLHLLALFYKAAKMHRQDTLNELLNASDCETLCHWLQSQSLLYYDPAFDCVIVHAGLAPEWTLDEALGYAQEIENMLKSETESKHFFAHMFGDLPNFWRADLSGVERQRVILNYLTRIRYCDTKGHLDLTYKGPLHERPAHLEPWFSYPGRVWHTHRVIFGHWAALMGQATVPQVIALDSGCVWGGRLTAFRLEDNQFFSVKGWQK